MNMPEELMPLPPFGEPAALEHLDRYLDNDGDPDEFHPVARWSIDNDGTAEWALRKLTAAEHELVSVEEQARAWQLDIELWRTRQSTRLHRTADFFRGHLNRYGLERRELTGAATLELPSGKVSTRKGNPRAYVSDEPLLIAALKRLGRKDLVRTREDVLISTLLEDEMLHARFREVPGGWKIALDCGCVTFTHGQALDACPECGATPVHPVDGEEISPAGWELWVTIAGNDLQLPGVSVESPETSVTVKVRS